MNYLPPATNITAGMADMFNIILKWEPVAANCTPEYNVVISSLDYIEMGTKESSSMMDIFVHSRRFDPNDYFTTSIQVKCNETRSTWANKTHMQLTSGNETISVKNLSCVWHYMDYINCTWQRRVDTPPNIQYRLLYWEKDTDSESLPESTQLHDLLHTGTECQDYFPPGGMYLGCKFKYEYSIANHKELLFMVTDTSYSAKPFLYYAKANDIGKLRSPTITYVSKATNNNVHINWIVTPPYKNLISEVLVSNYEMAFKVTNNFTMKLPIPNSDYNFTVKVRVKFSEYIADKSLYWSDWSKEYTFEGKDKNITSIFLLTLIPVAVVAVILLVYLKRLKILIFPPIPHPGKKFHYDLQNWLNSERPANVYTKPEEDISPVSLHEV